MDNNQIQNVDNNTYLSTNNENTIYIDGSILEGGGQILRISLALGGLLKKNVTITNIRGKRNPPGLKNQHSSTSESLANICGAKLLNCKVGSKELIFLSNQIKNLDLGKTHVCDCNSAGSIGLMIQQLLPYLTLAKEKCKLELIGGTIVSHSPSIFYISSILEPILNKMKVNFSMNVIRHGIFPIGKGKVLFETTPNNVIEPLELTERGKLHKVLVRVVSTNNFSIVESQQILKNLVKEVKKTLKSYNKSYDNYQNSDEDEEKYTVIDELINLNMKKGFTLFSQIILYFEKTIVSAEHTYSEKKELNQIKNFKSEILNKFDNILNSNLVCVDEYTVDHLIIFLAFAKGKSIIHVGEISLHTLTAIEVVKKFLPDIKIIITKNEEFNKLEVEGIGLVNEFVNNNFL